MFGIGERCAVGHEDIEIAVVVEIDQRESAALDLENLSAGSGAAGGRAIKSAASGDVGEREIRAVRRDGKSWDGGKSWERRPAAIPERCDFNVISRITQILFDPKDTSLVWASVEIDAIWRSADRGRSWTRVGKGLPTDDIHGIAVTHHGGRRRLYAATNRGLHVSLDDGESFTPVFVDTPRPYFRAITAGTGGTLLLTNGDGPPGSWGRIYRSDDGGETWANVPLSNEPNSTLWTASAHPFDPSLVFACSNLGEVYRSTDGARSFTKLKREMGEIRYALWRPV